MQFCSNCGTQLDPTSKFCHACGAEVVVPVAEPVAPVYTPPVYNNTTTAYSQNPSTKDKVTCYVGMGLSIGGLFFAVLGIFSTLAGMVDEGLGFGFAIAYSLFSVPLSIIGKIFSGKSYDAGITSTACSVGSGLGLAGIICSAFMLLLGFINLMI